MKEGTIERINELAKKAKSQGLTDLETAERAALRREYIESFKANTRAALENVYIVDENGKKEKIEKRK